MDTLELFLREITYQLGIEWHRIPVVVLATLGIYLSFMILVKVFGSRVLTSMTASDAIIIIMFGAVAGRKVVKWTRFLDRRPVLLVFRGKMVEENLTLAHITKSDIYSAARKAGISRMQDVQIMILEPTGHISVIRVGQIIDPELFKDLVGAEYIEDAKES